MCNSLTYIWPCGESVKTHYRPIRSASKYRSGSKMYMHERDGMRGREGSWRSGVRGNQFNQPFLPWYYYHTLSPYAALLLPLSFCLITASSSSSTPLSTHCSSLHHFIYYISASPFSLLFFPFSQPDPHFLFCLPTLLPPFFPPSLRIS